MNTILLPNKSNNILKVLKKVKDLTKWMKFEIVPKTRFFPFTNPDIISFSQWNSVQKKEKKISTEKRFKTPQPPKESKKNLQIHQLCITIW